MRFVYVKHADFVYMYVGTRYAYIAKGFEPDFRLLKIPDEDAQIFVQRIANINGNRPPLPNNFFNLTKVISAYCRAHDVHFKDGQDHVLQNPYEMFSHFDINLKPDGRRFTKKFMKPRIQKKFPNIPEDFTVAEFFHPDRIEHSARDAIQQSGVMVHARLKEIDYGPLKNSGVTWKYLDEAFKCGALNLHETGCDSLRAFLICRKVISAEITYQDIEQSARETLAKTGQRLKQDGGAIEHGPLRGVITQAALHLSIHHGYHGLQKGLFDGLKDFQDQCGIPLTSNNKGWTRGEIIRLSDVAIALRLTHLIEGHRLTKNDGPVKYGELAGEDCLRIDQAFKRGHRGLKDCGFDGISAYADHIGIPHDPHHAKSLVSRTKNMRFSLEDAEQTFNLHIAEDGRIPSADNTPITLGPLAKLNLTFAAANVSIARQKDIHGYSGMKALMEDRCGEVAMWYAPTSWLAKKFAANVGVSYDMARHIASLTMDQIMMSPPPTIPEAETKKIVAAPAPVTK